MKENKEFKFNLSTFLLILAIIIILIMGVFILKLKNEKNIETQKATELETQLSNLNSTVNNLQEKTSLENINNMESNTVDKQPTNNTSTTVENNYTEITTKLNEDDLFYVTNAVKNSDNSYTLRGVLYTKFTLSKLELENAVKNGNYNYLNQYGTEPEYVNYTVKENYKGYDYAFIEKFEDEDRVCFYATKKDSNTYYIQNDTEFVDEWILTDNYKSITVSDDIIVENDFDSSKVKDYFNNFEDRTVSKTNSHPSPCYTFEFSNGKCSKILEMETGH